ncbi:MAG: restriction endonuclease, partial [Acidobacteriota bacterium]|nr:restriction endonuclease [Acidobacteriota bacterium]
MSSFDLGSAHVTTFYSFKGGVGRSLLLANVGWMLAARRRVLLWDLDVEAPGLHRIPALEPAEVPRGFFEWLTDKSEQEPIELAGLGEMPEEWAESLRGLVQPVPGRPHLSILPAFGEGADFARLYAEGPWRRLLVEQPAVGLAVFRAILQVLAEEQDHILIDSRTGITDIGGFLAALLPHATVLVGSYGHQSVEGLFHVHKALDEAVAGRLEPRVALGAGSKLERIHVVSPVPPDDSGAAEKRRAVWKKRFAEVRPIEVPLDRRLLWGEKLLGAEDPSSSVAGAYSQVEERLQQSRFELLADREAADEEAAKFPDQDRLQGALGPSLRTRQGKSFEDRVARLLELHGYRVEREQILGGHKVDLVARIVGGLDEQCWWVECKDHRKPIGVKVFDELGVWIGGQAGRAQGARGMVVARSFSPAALTMVADRHDLRAWTLEDLERRLFDPRRYLTSLVSSFENSVLGRTYVKQRVLPEERDEENPFRRLLPYAQEWVEGKGPRLWLLLGDYGTGKSAFFQRFVYELARRALDDPEQPFPLAIDLKRFPNA